VRPWQFVLEPLRGYLMVADRLLARDAGCATGWNFGPAPEAEMPVSELARAMAGAWGAGEIIEDPQTGQVHEAGLLRLDSSKAAHELRWKPLLDITESLRWTVEWYQCCLQDETALASLTRRQIDAYQKLWDSAA
jgi:CDP-glucose 4,6-dehydratase